MRTGPGAATPIHGSVDDLGAAIADAYLAVVKAGIDAHPRSAQKLIGPSEIGIACTRALLHKLHKDQEPDRGHPWKPTVGTALHKQMEEWFAAAAGAGWLIEQRVEVGRIGNDLITGSTDLFNTLAGVVIDHKFVGKNRLKMYKGSGPSEQYRTQAHLYGRGWALDGWPVRMVMIAFIPRDGELEDSYFWFEPYDEQIALDALERANRLLTLIGVLGLDAAVASYPRCDDSFCLWCGTGTSWPARPVKRTTAELFA